MNRRLPRSFFWIDQQLIRSGRWGRLSAASRLLYVALAASCDREGVSIYSRSKLMELSAIVNRSSFDESLVELESARLIERRPEQRPPAIALCPFGTGGDAPSPISATAPPAACVAQGTAIVIHTHTTVQVRNAVSDERISQHVEPGNSG